MVTSSPSSSSSSAARRSSSSLRSSGLSFAMGKPPAQAYHGYYPDMDDPTRACACGCGTPVMNKWARGHAARGEGGYAGQAPAAVQPLPPPDDPWWELDGGGPHEDMGVLDPDAAPGPGPGPAGAGPVREPGPPEPDPPPAHGGRQWRKSGPRSAPKK